LCIVFSGCQKDLPEIITGCMDASACNYDSDADQELEDDCEYPETYYDCSGDCLVDLNNNGLCDQLEATGCMDTSACNYDPQATFDTQICLFPIDLYPSSSIDGVSYVDCSENCLIDEDSDNICDQIDDCIGEYDECGECNGDGPQLYYDCDGNCINDIDGDGVCDENEISGCTDNNPSTNGGIACNYNPEAEISDGSCTYPNECGSCTGDVSCLGCTVPGACNYSWTATIDDGSCTYPNECNSCFGDISCLGCTDPWAVNYIPSATVDDGSCVYEVGCQDGEVYDCNNNCAPLAWIGDGTCDNGNYTYNGVYIYFYCDQWSWDGGDCIGGMPSNEKKGSKPGR